MTIKDFVKNPELMKTEVKDINEILTIIKNSLEEVTMEETDAGICDQTICPIYDHKETQ